MEFVERTSFPVFGTILFESPKRFGKGRLKIDTLVNIDGDTMTALRLVSRDEVDFASLTLAPSERLQLIDALKAIDDSSVCPECASPIERPTTGRTPKYCSAACRQAAYRQRVNR